MKRIGAALIFLAAVGGCQKGTFVTLSFTQAVTTPATARIDLALTLDGAPAKTTLGGTTAITFPTTATLEIGHGTGLLTVTATAYAATSKVIDSATNSVQLVADHTVPLALALGGPVPDMATVGDLALDMVTDMVTDLAPAGSAPSAPQNVVASGGNAQVTLTWSAPADNGGSSIQSYTITPSPAGTTMMTNGTTTTVTFTGLTNDTTYTFSVVATNATGTSVAASSNPVTPTGTPMVPSAPTMVTALANVDHGATVSWTAADNHGSPLQGYAIVQAGMTQVLGTAGPSATSGQVTGLTPGTTYNFTVTATNGIGTSNASFPSNNIVAATLPTAPTMVSAAPNVDHGATVTWTAPTAGANSGYSPLTKFTVTASPGGAMATTPDGNTTTAMVGGLTAGTSYTFSVVASNIIGDSPASTESTGVVVLAKPPAPGSVAACGSDKHIKVTFGSVTGATSYNLYYSTSTPATGGTEKTNVTSPIIVPVTNGTYHVVVTAVDSIGEGPPSTDQTALADPQIHDTLFVGGPGGVDAFDCFSKSAPAAFAARTFATTGTAGYIAVDPVNAYVWATVGNGVNGYADATSVNGSTAAAASLGETGLIAQTLAIDVPRQRFYFFNAEPSGAYEDEILAVSYTKPSDLNTSSPTIIANFLNQGFTLTTPTQLFVDSATGNLWASYQPSSFGRGDALHVCRVGFWVRQWRRKNVRFAGGGDAVRRRLRAGKRRHALRVVRQWHLCTAQHRRRRVGHAQHQPLDHQLGRSGRRRELAADRPQRQHHPGVEPHQPAAEPDAVGDSERRAGDHVLRSVETGAPRRQTRRGVV